MTQVLEAARTTVSDERALVEAEADAFEALDRRLADLSTVTVERSPPLTTTPRQSDRSLERARTAYEETVMSVPHYDRDYGDTLAESLAAEFGDDIAAALVDGPALTPELGDVLRAAVAASRRERTQFLDVLAHEAESLGRIANDLASIRADLERLDDRPLSERGFDDLRTLWDRVGDLEARLDGVAMRRQETLDGHRGGLPGVPRNLQDYLYVDLSVTYPGLVAIAELGSTHRRARRRVERALVTTP
jgi:hypothetical protein